MFILVCGRGYDNKKKEKKNLVPRGNNGSSLSSGGSGSRGSSSGRRTVNDLLSLGRCSRRSCGHLLQLLRPLHICLESDSREDNGDHGPLLKRKLMSVCNNGQEDGEEFPGDGDSDKRERAVVLEGIKDEALAKGAADREHGDILDNSRMGLTEGESLAEFRVEGVQEPGGHVGGHEEVHEAHHLLSCDLVGMEDLVLGRVGDTVEGQVDRHQEESIQR